jgi:hypothetical protein
MTYETFYDDGEETGTIGSCKLRLSASVVINFFVFSTDGDEAIKDASHSEDVTGVSMDDPYPFLAQAINDVYLQSSLQYEIYTKVIANIWVGKGVHHFFFCDSGEVGSICSLPLM